MGVKGFDLNKVVWLSREYCCNRSSQNTTAYFAIGQVWGVQVSALAALFLLWDVCYHLSIIDFILNFLFIWLNNDWLNLSSWCNRINLHLSIFHESQVTGKFAPGLIEWSQFSKDCYLSFLSGENLAWNIRLRQSKVNLLLLI